MNRISFLMPLVLTVVAFGCGKPSSENLPVTAEHAAKSTANVSTPVVTPTASADKWASDEQPAKAPAEGSAAEAFLKTLAAFQAGRIDTVYDGLPAAYQADVENLVRLFAEKMDPELWSKAFGLLAKTATVMRDKKAMIFSMDLMKIVPQADSLKENWESIVAGIHTVAASEVADLKSLKLADLKYLLSAGSDLLQGFPLPRFDDVTVTTVNSDGETETILYREAKGSEPKEVKFVKVDGKWLPKSIATSWSSSIDDLKTRLSTFPDRIKQVKPDALKQLDSIDAMLGRMQGAMNRDEFTGYLMPLIFTLRFASQMATEQWKEESARSRTDGAVRVEISRSLSDEQQTELKDAIVASLGITEVDYEMIANDGKTRCRFSPVADGATLVSVIEKQFDGASVRWNAETKTIQVELK
ncbi:hypothetical protein [Schlesneria paludicola]|uniref:hypothetical protein n=1 Tax=Schlesneria paludicola TaxID=360056 RepID=UPI00029AC247|nr:hypothetical protein [Schlesneria paludicola]